MLPRQVRPEFGERYSALEQHFRGRLREKFSELLLKLSCYCEVKQNVNDGGDVEVLAGGGVITLDRDDAYATLYDADDDLLELVRVIAEGEGLFLWRPPQD